MTEFDVFDQRLGDALRAYAVDAPSVDDAAGFARAIAVAHPRRAGLRRLFAGSTARRTALIALVALLILGAVWVIVAGGLRKPVTLPLPVPDQLFGTYEATAVGEAGARVPGGTYRLRLDRETLLTGPEDEALGWAGAARALVPMPTGGLDLIVSGGDSCGDGRYAIGTNDGSTDSLPAPSASGGNPTPDPDKTLLDLVGENGEFVLRPVDEPCADRFAILTAGPWARPSRELQADEQYEAADFTEPFNFVLPTNRGDLATVMRTRGKGVLALGNGYDWRGFFLDDVALGSDFCKPDVGTLPDLPATPAAVEAWLRSSSGLRVGPSESIEVDGRNGLVMSTEVLDCPMAEPPRTAQPFYLGSRTYAIPTGDDLVLFTAGSFGMPAIDAFTDDLVRSIRFER